MTDPQPSISLAISDLEREASALRTENREQKETFLVKQEQIRSLLSDFKSVRDERDSYMRLSAELKTLLDSAATLILEGLKRVREGTDRTDTLETITPTPEKAQP